MSAASTELAIVDRGDALALTPISDAQGAKARLAQLAAFVKSVMVEGHDFGTIPGTDKPTLYKPGAEKLLEMYGLAATYDVTQRVEDWERGFWHYEVRCRITSRRDGGSVGEGLGSCNSMEARYRWRTEWWNGNGAPTGEGWKQKRTKNGARWVRRVENEDRWDLPNTLLKMAKKRGQVDATLSVTRSSGLFTQDMEDLRADDDDDPTPSPPPRRQPPPPQPQRASRPVRGEIVPPVIPASTADRLLSAGETRKLREDVTAIFRAAGWRDDEMVAAVSRRMAEIGVQSVEKLGLHASQNFRRWAEEASASAASPPVPDTAPVDDDEADANAQFAAL